MDEECVYEEVFEFRFLARVRRVGVKGNHFL